MRNNFCRSLVFFLLLVTYQLANAQVTPVQVTPQLVPPYSLQVSEYYSGSIPKIQVLLINRDINQPTIQVKLKMTVESQNCRLRTKEVNTVPAITLTNGVPYYLAASELQALFSSANLDFGGGLSEQQYNQTLRLPEGLYTFTFEAYELYSGNLVSNKGFSMGWLTLADPPLLNTPSKGEEVTPNSTQSIVFNWTPRHNTSPTAAYYTEYLFTLVEYNDAALSPEAAFASSNPILQKTVSTTTMLFSSQEPITTNLVEGKRYAWRVQAKAKSNTNAQEIAMFRNNGISEVHWFVYKNSCTAPQGITVNVQGQRATIEWQNNPLHLEWKVEYREQNNPKAEWFTLSNTLPRVVIMDLKPSTNYEYRVGGACYVNQFTYSPLNFFSTANAPVPPVVNCGDSTFPALGTAGLQTLNPGDSIRAGNFVVKVGYSTGSGSFTGTGYVIVPWLMNAKVEVKFTNITMSTDYKLVSGLIETTYDPTESGIDDIDEYVDIFKAGYGVGDVVTGEVTADKTVDFIVQWPNGITVVKPADYNEATGKGTSPVSITLTPQGGGAATTYTVDQLPTTIKDKAGNLYQVDKAGNISQIGKAGGDVLLKQLNTKVIDKDKAEVKFVDYPTKQVYAFDAWNDIYKKSSTFSKEYERIGDYYVSQKAIAPGQTDYLKAVVTVTDTSVNPRNIEFVNGKGTIYSKKALDSTYKVYEIAIVGGPEKDAQEIYAVYKPSSTKTLNLGKVKVSSYPKREFKVKLVPVNNASVNFNTITSELNRIYNKVNIYFNVENDNNYSNTLWDKDGDGMDVKGSNLLAVYTDEMRSLNKSYQRDRGIDNETIYMFILQNADTSVFGMMPRGKKFGYVFLQSGGNSNPNPGSTLVHELGHGKLALKHVFEDYDFAQGGLSGNVMDYPVGERFSKAQWDLIHDPAIVLSFLDNESEIWQVGESNLAEFNRQTLSSNPTGQTYYLDPKGRFFKVSLIAQEDSDYRLFIYKPDKLKDLKYFVTGVKKNGVLYTARIEDGLFTGFYSAGGIMLSENLYVVTSPSNEDKARILVPDPGNNCFFGFQDIKWNPAIVQTQTVQQVMARIYTLLESEWKSDYYYQKNSNSPECGSIMYLDTSVLLVGGLPNYVTSLIQEYTKVDRVNPLTQRAVRIKYRVIFSYEDATKNKKVINVDPLNRLLIGGEVVEPAADEILIWMQINNNQKLTAKHIQLGKYLQETAKEVLESFGKDLDWYQKTIWERFCSDLSDHGEEVIKWGVDMFDWMASGIRKLKIPEKVYNPNHPDYNPTFQQIFSYILPSNFVVDKVYDKVKELLSNSGVTIPSNAPSPSQLSFAFICGVYNGLIDVVGSVPEILGAVVSLLGEEGRNDLLSKANQFVDLKIYDNNGALICDSTQYWCKIKQMLAGVFSEMFSLEASKLCNTSHNIGSIIGPIVVMALTGDIAALEGTASGAAKTFINILKWCDNFGISQLKHLNISGRMIKNSTGKLVFQLKKGAEFLVEQLDDFNFRVKVLVKNTGQFIQETVSNEQLQLLMNAAGDGFVNISGRDIKMTFSELADRITYLSNLTGLTSGFVDDLIKAGIKPDHIDKLASLFGKRVGQYNRFLKLVNENFAGDATSLQVFMRDISNGLPDNPSALLKYFDEVPDFNIKIWETLRKGNHTGLLTDLDVFKQLHLLFNSYPEANWGRILELSGSKRKIIEQLTLLKGKPGLGAVLSDLANSSNKYQGASFVVEYATSNGDDFTKAITKFEVYDNDIVNGIRKYDIQIGISPNQINIECKHWWESWKGSTFKEQFLKDLGKMTSLGQVLWKFKKTTSVTPDISTLKDRVLKSLGTWDDVSQKWIAGSELSEMFLDESLRLNIRTVFGSGITDANSLINEINKDNIFKMIFEIIN